MRNINFKSRRHNKGKIQHNIRDQSVRPNFDKFSIISMAFSQIRPFSNSYTIIAIRVGPNALDRAAANSGYRQFHNVQLVPVNRGQTLNLWTLKCCVAL